MSGVFEWNGNRATGQDGAMAVVDRCVDILSPKLGCGVLAPIPTGFPELDGHLGGLHPGELIVLAARPGVGKTSLALQIALNAARSKSNMVYFSLESSTRQLALVLLSQGSRIPFEVLRQLVSSTSGVAVEVSRLDSAVDELEGLEIRMYDAPGVPLSEIQATTNVYARCHGGALCVVDLIADVDWEVRGDGV